MDPSRPHALAPAYAIGGAAMSLIALAVGVLGLMAPLDPVGTSTSALIALVGASGMIGLAYRLWRGRARSN